MQIEKTLSRLKALFHAPLRRFRQTKTADWLQKNVIEHPNLKIPFQAIPLWLAAALTGIVAVVYEHLFKMGEQLAEVLYRSSPRIVFLSTPLFFLAARFLIVRFAPTGKGSGIPQLMVAAEIAGTERGRYTQKFLSGPIALTKIASSFLLLLGGGAIGREGPTLQVAGSISKVVYGWVPSTWPRVSERIMIITGGASGLAAAFNTPLGGIVYVIEELTRSHITKFRTAVFSAVIIAGMTAQSFLGSYLYLGYPKVVSAPFYWSFAVILLAFIAGMSGSIFTRLLLRISKFADRYNSQLKIQFVCLLGLLFALMFFFSGPLAIGSGKTVINDILFSGADSVPWYAFPVRFLGALISFSVGAAGGIFATALASGASLAALLVGLIGIPVNHHNLMVLVCMIAFLTGVTRSPFTSTVLVLEMTDRHSAIFYFLLSAMTAQLAASMVMSKSFYEIQKEGYLSSLTQALSGKESPNTETPAPASPEEVPRGTT